MLVPFALILEELFAYDARVHSHPKELWLHALSLLTLGSELSHFGAESLERDSCFTLDFWELVRFVLVVLAAHHLCDCLCHPVCRCSCFNI